MFNLFLSTVPWKRMGKRGISPLHFNLSTRWTKWIAWRPGRFIPSEELLVVIKRVRWVGAKLSPLGTRPLIDLLYQPRMIDEYGVFGEMRTSRGNRSNERKPAPMPLCPIQIPHDLTWARTRTSAVGIQRLTAWAMARWISRILTENS
jgi:hypothetical protein